MDTLSMLEKKDWDIGNYVSVNNFIEIKNRGVRT